MRNIGYMGESMTKRRVQVLQLLADGHTAQRTAERLAVSRNTVKTAVTTILRVLDVANTKEAIAEGMRRGIIT